MGFLSRLFGRDDDNGGDGTTPVKKVSPQIARLIKKVENKYGQAQDRQIAIDQLAQVGTAEAAAGLLKRFSFRIEQTIGDEEEKQAVCNHLVVLGPTAVEPILEYLREENAPYWPTKALRQIVGDDATVTYLLDIIRNMDAIFDRDINRKIELVSNLCEFDHPDVVAALFEFARDENEEIRVRTVEAMARIGNEELCEIMVDRLMEDSETRRMKLAILNLLVDRKWKVKSRKEEIRKILPEAYWIDDVGTIRSR